ncbi:hypothetical protein PVAND_017291 [Polypedilum vanderplanki]|uniref:Metalloendopeptidase n=1 Tax=Polypedilum vanderplanki TaxID=319348 RepID=A0A9J6BHU6_POLVA|nr:hypothetical protein PVAND_017291 [Polypedilum vanderplanki]
MKWDFKLLIIITCFSNFIVIGQFTTTKEFNQVFPTTASTAVNLLPRDDDEPADLSLYLRKNNLQLESRKFYEGDIKIDENKIEKPDEDDLLKQHDDGGTGLKDKDEKWKKKNGFVTVPYVIDSTVYSDFQIRNIKYAMRIIEYETDCIRFKKRKKEGDFILFTMRENGCWSYVGRIGGRQIINLDSYCAEEYGVAIHEIIHALGFYHMHSHTQRDDYVQIKYQNIHFDDQHNFDKISRHEASSYATKYDYLSIMHYGPFYFSKNGGMTIVPKNSKYLDYIGQRSKMSPGDIKRLRNMYQCNDKKIEPKIKENKKVEESEEFEEEESENEEEYEESESEELQTEEEEENSTEHQSRQVNVHFRINTKQGTISNYDQQQNKFSNNEEVHDQSDDDDEEQNDSNFENEEDESDEHDDEN